MCAARGMGSEAATIERPGPVISNNLFTTPTTALTPNPSVQPATLLWPWTASLLRLCRLFTSHTFMSALMLLNRLPTVHLDGLALSLPSRLSLMLITSLYFWSCLQIGIYLLKAKPRPVQYNSLPLLPLSEVSANICCIPRWHSAWIHSVLPLLLSCQCQQDGLKNALTVPLMF